MNLKLAVSGLVIASLLLGDQAQAQTSGNGLRGIKQLHLLFEEPGNAQKECQITEALMRDAFMYPASSARFAVTERSPSLPYMYFNVVALIFKQSQLCVSHIDMRLRVNQSVNLEASSQRVLASVDLWYEGSIQSSVKGEHARAVRDSIERKTKKFITDWNLDNK